jgi:hypothetical protein
MADTEASGLGALTTLANDDLFYVVDKSDTSGSANGTSKKIRKDDALKASNTLFTPYGDNTATDMQAAIQSIEDRMGGYAFIDDLEVAVQLTDHFLGGNRTDGMIGELGWTLGVGASGACTDLPSTLDGNCGRISPATGTDAAGYAEIQLRNTVASIHMQGAPPFIYEWKVRVPVLPTSAQDFTGLFGFADKSTTADPLFGFYFLLQTFAVDATPAWMCVCADNGTRTTTDSGIAVVASTDYKLRCICDGAGTAYFYIDDVLVHTQTTSTNFPDSGDGYAPTAKVRKTAGTTSRTTQADYFAMRYEFI